ncbi:hypothetical protein AAVH_08145 [Aphelenchoides avenae]|nr:hypothetical protein AAVH_08145 [Aphelenchus avenae]
MNHFSPYGGNASVKNAKLPNDANVNLAVLELTFAVEISDSTIPVCVGGTSDEKSYHEYKGLHFGPKNKSEDNELARAMYQDVLLRADEKECTKALADDYNKDTQFCVGKRNLVFAEGIYTGGPILVRRQPSGRFLQVGIALKADAENNYGSSTRVALYQKEIGELTGCFLVGAGLNSTTSSKQNCDDVSTTTSTTKRTTVRTTTVGSIAYKITKENCKDLGYCDIVEFGNDNDPRISLTTANKEKTMALAIRLTEEANGVFSFDVEYGVDPDCLDTTDTKFHFGEQYGSWSGDSKDFKVIMIKGTVDPVVPFELKERLRITVDPRSKVLTVECGSEHNWMNSSVIASVGSKDPHLFYTPQFYLDFWEETSTHDIWCTVPAQQFVKIIMHNAELWTAPSASDGL